MGRDLLIHHWQTALKKSFRLGLPARCPIPRSTTPSPMLCATAGVGCQYTPRRGTRRRAELITWAGVVNYALFDTPLEDTYGANVPRL